jgi:hypothetical protein
MHQMQIDVQDGGFSFFLLNDMAIPNLLKQCSWSQFAHLIFYLSSSKKRGNKERVIEEYFNKMNLSFNNQFFNNGFVRLFHL